MKGIFTGICIALSLVSALALAACNGGADKGTAYEGEYAYETEYGTYGVKVGVSVKDEKIADVEILASDYTEVTDSWEGKENYLANRQSMLDSFVGKTVAEVKAYTVVKESDGAPASVSAEGLTVVTGATQCSGRLILAVQNALSQI